MSATKATVNEAHYWTHAHQSQQSPQLDHGMHDGRKSTGPARDVATISPGRQHVSADDRRARPIALTGDSGNTAQATAPSETCRSPPPYDTSSSDISDESMNAHADDLTPSASPEKADSPVTTSAKLGRLSLQQQREAGYGAGGAANDDGVRGSRTAATPLNSSLSSRHVSRPQQAAVSSPSPQDLPTQPKKRREVKRQCRSQRLAAGTRKATESNVRDPSGRCKTYTSRQDSGYATLLSGSKEGSTQWSKQTPRPKISETPREIPPSSPRNTICEQAAPEQSGVNSSLANVRFPGLVLQPDSSPISQDQLATEVKGIYAGLVMVESKCINIDAAQASDPSTVLAPEQWQALVALHRTLLYEHHDFLMATQHPSATSALKALPLRYSMPARMWKHGIHAFLEVLRHRRPHSQDYMLAFIYLAYQMMALLFETIPAFLDTWIECLGDLARYRMAIEQEREPHAQWGGVAASWYLKAADRHPEIGRLYHHLGILERPSLRKFACYGKSLTCVMPFPNARDSLKTLCNSIKEDGDAAKRFRRSTEARMCIMFALIFLKEGRDAIDAARTVAFRLVEIPDSFCWRECGVPLAITSISALLAQGSPTNPIRSAYDAFIQTQMGTSPSPSNDTPGPRPAANGLQASPDTQSDQGNMLLSTARSIMLSTLSYSLQTRNDANSIRDVLPFVHVMLCFLHSLSFIHNRYHTACTFSELEEAPWSQLACFLNSLLRIELLTQRVEQCARHGVWLRSEEGNNSSLSEDYAIRGLFWSSCTFGPGRFDNGEDEFERSIENTSTHKNRVERVLYYALRLAFESTYLQFDFNSRTFKAAGSDIAEATVQPLTTNEAVPSDTSLLPSPTSVSAHGFSDGDFVHVGHPMQPSMPLPQHVPSSCVSVASVSPEQSTTYDDKHIAAGNVQIAESDAMHWEAA